MNGEFVIYATLFSFFIFLVLRAFERWILPRWIKPDRFLERREFELQGEIDELERRLSASEGKNRELENNQDLLLRELRRSNIQIERQNDKIRHLEGEVRILQKTSPITPIETTPFKGRVLGIWPDTQDLNTSEERFSIARTGLEYEALEGAMATRRGIVEQLSQREYKIVEIGAKGGAEGIKLYDDIAPPSWWMQLARQHNIEIFVVLANESSKPGVENVADSLFNAGAKAVVSVDSSILDKDAIEFSSMMYRRLSRGVPLAKAVDYAKLVISSSGSDTIKLRERK